MQKQGTKSNYSSKSSCLSKSISQAGSFITGSSLHGYSDSDPFCKTPQQIIASPEKFLSTKEIEALKSTQQRSEKKRVFLELMGYTNKATENILTHSPLKTEFHTPKISVTDFMGGKRYNFLKKTGFLKMYDEKRRFDEVKKIKDSKNIFSHSNIQHMDLIRKSMINIEIPKIRHSQNLSHFEIPVSITPFEGKSRKSHRIEEIEEIINKCEMLNKKNPELEKIEKELENHVVIRNKPETGRRKQKRLTNKELNTIRLTASRVE